MQMEWALNRDDYSVEQLQVYKFNKPGRQFVKWSQPKLDPRLSYLVENTAEVLHKNITVRDRTVRAAAEQHVRAPSLPFPKSQTPPPLSRVGVRVAVLPQVRFRFRSLQEPPPPPFSAPLRCLFAKTDQSDVSDGGQD